MKGLFNLEEGQKLVIGEGVDITYDGNLVTFSTSYTPNDLDRKPQEIHLSAGKEALTRTDILMMDSPFTTSRNKKVDVPTEQWQKKIERKIDCLVNHVGKLQKLHWEELVATATNDRKIKHTQDN